MKELFAPKHMKMFVTVVILSILTGIGFLYMFVSKKSKLSASVRSKKVEVDRKLDAKDSPRREDNIALKNMIITVGGKNKEIASYVLSDKLEKPDLSPLEFKEEMEKTEAVIKKNAGFPIPEGIGFSKFRGGVIPESSEVGVLTTELLYTKEILELLINAEVVSVERLEWYNVVEDDMVSSNYLLELDFVGNTDSLIKFMVNLQNTKSFIMLHKLSIKRLENLKLLIKVHLKAVEFDTEKEVKMPQKKKKRRKK